MVDGIASEEVWGCLPEATDFVERYPRSGRRAGHKTTFRVVFDLRAIYFFIEAWDEETAKIVGQLTPRDLDSASDWVEVIVDPQNNLQTGYRFAVNARGVQLDARLSQGGAVEDRSYNAAWRSAVQRFGGGYRVEMRIPFAELRYSGQASAWGMQVVRRVARTAETSVYNPTPKYASRPLLHSARLLGLDSLAERSSVGFRPYSLLKWQSNGRPQTFGVRYGGDARLGLGSSTTIHTTVLPDFGQVEQDPSQLNLTAYQIYLTERRPFFLDGLEHLDTPLSFRSGGNETLYYSRRIGAAPKVVHGYARDDFEDYPNYSTIINASKVLYRGESGINASYIGALTAADTAWLSADGAKLQVAPLTSLNVARVKQELQGGRGHVGATGTYLHRYVSPRLGVELTSDAVTGGPDFDLRFGDYAIMGQLVGSRISGSADAVDRVQRSSTNLLQRPNAGHLDYNPEATEMSGYALSMAGGKFDGSPWRAYWGGHVRSPGFNTNDLGFLQIADHQKWETAIGYRFDQSTQFSRAGLVELAGWIEKTNGIEITDIGTSLATDWDFSNSSHGWAGIAVHPEVNDVRLLRGGPGFLIPASTGGWWGYQTDVRKKWNMSITGNFDLRSKRSRSRFYLAWLTTLRPTSALSFSLIPTFEGSTDDLQYVEAKDQGGVEQIILGRLSRQTYSLTVRMDWALALGLSLRLYAMPYVSAGRYSRFYLLEDGLASNYFERRSETEYDGATQFINTQLRSTVVGRWEFLPLSSLYLVWTHEQGSSDQENGKVVPGRELSALVESEAVDVLMLKAEVYWAP